MDNILLSAGLAFIITFFSIPVIIKVAKEKKLYDEPDERKVHKNVIPTLGGMGIFAGFIVSLLMGISSANNPEFQYFVAACLVIFFMGLKDDVMILSASKKFIGQLVSAAIIIRFGGIQLSDMHGFLGIHTIPPVASYALTAFTIIVVTNAFNLIDGIDGLAGSLGLVTSVSFGLYFYFIGNISYSVMAFSLSAGIFAFLIYNFAPAKIFMGDTGSLLLGTVNSILVIKFIQLAPLTPTSFQIQSAPAIGFAILMVPLFDTLRVFTIRIFKRRSPFSPDRNHIHHFLLDLGLSHRKIVLVMSATAVAFIAISWLMRSLDTTFIIGSLLGLGFLLTATVYQLRKNSIKRLVQSRTRKEPMRMPKITAYHPEIAEAK